MYAKKRRTWSFDDLIAKSMKYCAYQERCISELQKKLFEWGATKNISDKIADKIIDEGFINENRYVEFYVKGKVNIKKWGKIKIRASLKQKQIDDNIIEKYIGNIPDNTYTENIKSLALKKLKELESESDTIFKKQRLFRYLASRGYESELISSTISNAISG